MLSDVKLQISLHVTVGRIAIVLLLPVLSFCHCSFPRSSLRLLATYVSAYHLSHGVYQAAEPREASRVQILWSRPFPGIEIYTETLLHKCRYQMLPNVYGVSQGSPLRSRYCH